MPKLNAFLFSFVLLCQGAMALPLINPYPDLATEYLARAKMQEGNEKQQSLLSAAGRFISEHRWRQGLSILSQTKNLTRQQADEKQLLFAQVDSLQGKMKPALTQLDKVQDPKALSAYHQVLYQELLALSYLSMGNIVESLQARIAIEGLLTEKKLYNKNQKKLWLSLITQPEEALSALAKDLSPDSELFGWVQLAQLAHKYKENPNSLLAAIDEWQSQFYSHPANFMLPTPLDSIANKMLPSINQIALLLPLSGPFSGPGTAVQEGFMAALKANQKTATPTVRVYDTNKGDVSHTYKQAIEDGADYVVGPLLKSQVAVIAAMQHPVATLLLNDSNIPALDNAWFFGLSPTYEAAQVAMKARSKGYNKALIISPQNDWGKEVSQSFTSQWQKQGGLVVDILNYAEHDDLNKKMQDFLQITQAQHREKQIKQLLGPQIYSLSSRRQDFDVIFLLAYPSKARQIMPLLNYYYAKNVPTYATSSVYSGSINALKDKDLEGLIFCDIPWVFAHQMGSKNWPEQFNSYNRLYALGRDSFALTKQLNHLLLFPVDGENSHGLLYLSPRGQVARVLEWGRFKRGLVHSLGETT